MSDFEADPAPRIIERHHPMHALFEVFPEAASMERDLFQRVLGVPIRREQRQAGGNYEYVFLLIGAAPEVFFPETLVISAWRSFSGRTGGNTARSSIMSMRSIARSVSRRRSSI